MGIDIIFLIVAGFCFYTGWSQGIIQTVFTALSYLFGAMAAFKFAPTVTKMLETTLNNSSPMMFIAGFLVSFVLTIIVIRMIGRGMEGVMEVSHINIINQFFGGILLALIGVLFYSMLLWFADEARFVKAETKHESMTYSFLHEYPGVAKTVFVRIMPIFRDFWDTSLEVMDRMQRMSVEKTESDPNIYDIPEGDKEASPSRSKGRE